MDDGLMLNLVQSKKVVKKKKKAVKKSSSFLKKKLNQKKKGSTSFKPKIRTKNDKAKKEVDQNKEISTIQSEFSSGLDDAKATKKNDRLDENKSKDVNKSTSNDKPSYKSTKSNDRPSNQIDSKLNQEISMINDEFADEIIDAKDLNHSRTDNRNDNRNDRNNSRNDRNNRNDRPNNLKRKFNDDDRRDFRNSKSQKRFDRPSTSSDRHEDGFYSDKLKNEFNDLFASKNKETEPKKSAKSTGKFNDKFQNKFSDRKFGDKFDDSKFKSKFGKDSEERSHRNDFISDCFSSNPEIPAIKLKNLVDENKEDVFSDCKSFESLSERIHPHLISCLSNRLNIDKMTNVQARSIPFILDRTDCLIKSVTGSGKTIVYCVPIIQILQEKTPKITRTDGIYSLIIVPTRELVLQCYNILESLSKAFTYIVPGYLMGGENKHSEKSRIRKGINILVSTPGRLLDHIATTKSLDLSKIEILVIDEADRMYEAGFEESIKNILLFINEQKQDEQDQHIQTILLSATLSSGVQSLAGLVLKDAQLIDTFDENEQNQQKLTFPKNLKQYFCTVPAKLRLLTLSSFIFNKCSFEKSSKILVFMSTQDQVDFHFSLFNTTFNRLIQKNKQDPIEFFKLHGNMEQKERMKIFQQFKNTETGVLISTDVAARGLDLKEIEFVVQYTCPSTIEDYVHRIGRTARIEHNGSSLIFLLPSEINFLKYIQKELGANLDEMKAENILRVLLSFDFGKSKKCFREQASQLQFEFETAIIDDEDDKLELARKAYLSFVRAYATHPRSTKPILPFKELHLGHLCKSFGLRDSPRNLAGFKREFVQSKVKNRSETEKFSMKFTRNKKTINAMNKRMIPIENRVSEF